MGSACLTTQTQIFFESPYFHPISDETKPKPVNHSIKHDLKPKYNDIDCDCSRKPYTEDKASQTCLSFSNLNEERIQQCRTFASKNKKRHLKHQKQGMRQKFENANMHSNSGGQSTTLNCRDISPSQSLKGNKVREKYVIMINSQEEKQRNKSNTLQFSELFSN